MTDVAKHAGVSRPLVSMVLRGVDGPSERSKKAILASAAELGFRVNTSAQRLRQTRTRLIGVLFATHHPFEAEFVERLLERAPGRGFGVVLAPITASRGTDVVVSELMGHRVEALACFNPEPESAELQRVLDQLPVVWLGERSPEPRADAVRADDDRGLKLAVDHLVALGHRDICYIGGLGGEVGPDRAAAYRAAMRETGLDEHIDVAIADFTPESAVRVARELIGRAELPTAIIVGSDQGAAAVITVLARHGVSIPAEVSIIGYDDSDVAALSSNSLTSIKQDIEATVDATLQIIERRIADPSTPTRDHPTPATLVVRGSTGPARSAHHPD